MSLFKKASKKARRLKMYIYGESGSGKTVTSLHFPSPAMIDAEKGTDFYGELFDFERIQTNDPDEINAALDELLKDPGDVKTLILDPFTAVYEAMQDAQLRRMRVKNNNKNYTLQPVDFKLLKSNVKGLIQKLLALDLNIICTARARVEYSQEPGEFMKPVGLKPDGPKDLPYMFDVVLELKETPDGKRLASTIKDRTNTLPNSFEFSYEQ
ncbi:AAA family ATPase, partial [Candidatus Peregrinibacteria bacterium]|nr:AAA family ATPase [Candidatus Peregrinibacteria bacterium]